MFVRLARFQRLAFGVVVATILAAIVFVRPASALIALPDPQFGMVGVAQGQTARLNLVHTGSVTPGLVPPPCRADLGFLDADGNVLTTLTAEVPVGHSTFLDFTPLTVPINTNGDAIAPLRAEIRAAVTFLDNSVPPGPCRVNVEIFDVATGRTTVLLPPGPCRGAACLAVP